MQIYVGTYTGFIGLIVSLGNRFASHGEPLVRSFGDYGGFVSCGCLRSYLIWLDKVDIIKHTIDRYQ